MSLLLWLPLNGEIVNQGLMNKTLTNNGCTFNNGTLFGKMLTFNGSSNYIKMTNKIFNNGDTNGTITFWFYTTNASATQGIYSCRNTVGGGVTVFIYNSKIRFDTSSTTNTQFTYSVTANQWTHIACTFTKTEKKLYVNGELMQTVTGDFTVNTSSSDSDTIGCSSTNGTGNYGNYFVGNLNDLRVYNETLSPTEIKEISKGLYCHYKLDDVDTVTDVSGFNNHGALSSNKPTLIDSTGGINHKCLSFNGSNNFITTSKNCKLTNTMTACIWAYSTGFDGNTRVFSCTEGGGWNIESSPIQTPYYLTTKNAYVIAKSSIVPSTLNNGWHLFVTSFDGLNLKLYIDGVEVATNSVTPKDTIKYNTNNTIFLGAEAGGNATTPAGNYFSGYLSDFRLYATALSADDIMNLYKTRFTMDTNHKLYAKEFIENDKISMEPTGVLNTNISNYFNLDGETFILNNKIFTKIFYQNSQNGSVTFNSVEECQNTKGTYKYSRLKYMEYFLDNDNKYEFILKYPTVDANKYNHWTQTSNPLTTHKNSIANYTPIHIDWSTPNFGGIGLHNTNGGITPNTYLCCRVGNDNWWFAIATSTGYQGGIPGPGSTIVQQVELYVRIDNISIDKIRFLEQQFVVANDIIEN